MATIVQPYNPWREQLALTALGNVAGNIIGDIWKTHKQNEQNRKANAFRGQLQQNLGNISQNAEISLTPREAPHGYNPNPWASAFHQNASPLTAFDIGTAGIGKTPGIQDIAQSADSLAASKRFSMLSPEIVQGVKNSMIQQAENQRLRDLQNNFADMFGSADDIQGQMKALIMGATHGVVAPQVLTAFSPYARDVLAPYTFTESDLGQNKVISALNRITGMATPGMIMPVSVSPNTTANNETQRYVANRSAESSINAAKINAMSHELGYRSAAETARQQLALENYKQTIADYDNSVKGIDSSIASHVDFMNNNLQTDQERAIYRTKYIAPLEQEKARRTAERSMWQENYRRSLGFGGSQAQGSGQGISKSNYDDLISNASNKYGVDPDLIYAVAQIESGHKNGLTSSAGAQGIMQLMPDTAKRFGVNDVWNPEQNINGGVAYLKWLLDRYGGNEEKALQAYNCGEGRVARDGTKDKNNVPAVSIQYAKNVLAIANKRRAARQANSQNQNAPQTIAQQTSSPQTQQQPQNQGNTARFRNKEGQVITQTQFEDMVKDAQKDGYSQPWVEKRLREQGFTDSMSNHQPVSVAPALNWSPSYMRSIPQGQALTALTQPPARTPAQSSTPNSHEPYNQRQIIDGEFSDIPRFNALTPEELHSPLQGNFNSLQPLSVLNGDFYTEQESARRLLNGNFPFLPFGVDWSYLYR